MKLVLKGLAAITLVLCTATAFAEPTNFINDNNTDVETNAFVDGRPSPFPTVPHSSRKIKWSLVKTGCHHHTTNNICPAVIKVETDTDSPIELGTIKIDLDSGDITPTTLSANGYTLNVINAGEIMISKD